MEYALKEDKCRWKAVCSSQVSWYGTLLRLTSFVETVWFSGGNKKERKKKNQLIPRSMLVERYRLTIFPFPFRLCIFHSSISRYVSMFQVYKVWFWRESSWSMTMKYTFKLSQWRNLLAKGSVSFNSEFFFSNMEEMDGKRWKKVFRKFLRSTVSRKLEKSNKTSQDRDLKINNQSTLVYI